jgi:hypothetical protein
LMCSHITTLVRKAIERQPFHRKDEALLGRTDDDDGVDEEEEDEEELRGNRRRISPTN